MHLHLLVEVLIAYHGTLNYLNGTSGVAAVAAEKVGPCVDPMAIGYIDQETWTVDWVVVDSGLDVRSLVLVHSAVGRKTNLNLPGR